MSEVSVRILFGCAVLAAALCGPARRGRAVLAPLAAACAAAGVLAGLVSGRSTKELLAPVLAVCAAALAALRFGRGPAGK